MDHLALDRLPKRQPSMYSTKGTHFNSSHSFAEGQDEVWMNQLATHLPDQVVYADHYKTLPFQNTTQGILMFLDISGITLLIPRYNVRVMSMYLIW